MVRHQKELNFDPGQEYLYSNAGHTLLAVTVERVSGKSFREYTEANIFKPLGMTSTHFHDDHEMIVKNRAYSYAPVRDAGFKLAPLNYANVGATSLFTTGEDLARWVFNFEDKKVGGAAVIEQMQQEKFFVKENNSEITFERDEKGKVVRFTMSGGGQTQSARRLGPPATAAQLAEFAGDYYSPELGTTYTMVVKDSQLTAEHRRHNDIRLTELDGDLFSASQWFFQRVQFTRDDEKRINGFRLTAGRVRNPRFDKQSK